VLLGHEKCGAVTGAVLHPHEVEGHIGAIVQQIAPAADQARQTGKDGPELIEAATEAFLTLLAENLRRQSAVIDQALGHGRLELVVAKYGFEDGRVEPLFVSFF
jgi:carbonic anhydrase